MKRKDLIIILGFTAIILASTVPFIRNPDLGGYITLFEEIKFRLLYLRLLLFGWGI